MASKITIMSPLQENTLTEKANAIRKDVIRISTRNGAGHIAPSLSCIEILVVLYYAIMKISSNPEWEERDRLIFSKAHGAYGLYAILADIGYIQKNDWAHFYKGSFLPGCVERNVRHGLEASCGSLGHGLPMAVGIAFGAKLQNKKHHVYVIVGDGEMQEGSNWEAIQFAVKHQLSNLTIIIDANKLQAMDFLDNVLTVKGKKHDLIDKCSAFGCRMSSCNGHSIASIYKALCNNPTTSHNNSESPYVVVADTIKGYGLSCMENIPKFHFRIPTPEELQQDGY